MTRVVCAMSGGVDSSVAALLLKQQGYDVIGVSMKLSELPEDAGAKVSGCCSVKDFNDARAVCDALEIPFYAMNFREAFKEKVIDRFVAEYLRGRTPNPCVLCNQEIKFDAFLAKARELSADFVATGHYARIAPKNGNGGLSLLKGKDPNKDQSYFLFSLRKEDLKRILFPVGDLNKSEVREIARRNNLKTKDKPESQEICFVPNDDPGAFIDRYITSNDGSMVRPAHHRLGSPCPNKAKWDTLSLSKGEGEFVDVEGKVLGRHPGIHHFTVGQRRGTEVAVGRRFYVKAIDPVSRRITLADDPELYRQALIASDLSWVGRRPGEDEWVAAKIRYRHEPAACRVHPVGPSQVEVRFKEPQRAITPGQAVVFYDGEEVLGGGWIERPL